jgi:hypothetical protein
MPPRSSGHLLGSNAHLFARERGREERSRELLRAHHHIAQQPYWGSSKCEASISSSSNDRCPRRVPWPEARNRRARGDEVLLSFHRHPAGCLNGLAAEVRMLIRRTKHKLITLRAPIHDVDRVF